MADTNIKKIVVPQIDLPTSGYESLRHQLRFRIVSEDKARFTHWSPFYLIQNDGIDLTPGTIIPSPVLPTEPEPSIFLADFVDVVWEPPKPRNRRYRYDIFVRWMPSALGETNLTTYPFELLSSRYSGNSMKVKVEQTVLAEPSYYARFIVQLASSGRRDPKISNSPIFDSGDISLILDQS